MLVSHVAGLMWQHSLDALGCPEGGLAFASVEDEQTMLPQQKGFSVSVSYRTRVA